MVCGYNSHVCTIFVLWKVLKYQDFIASFTKNMFLPSTCFLERAITPSKTIQFWWFLFVWNPIIILNPTTYNKPIFKAVVCEISVLFAHSRKSLTFWPTDLIFSSCPHFGEGHRSYISLNIVSEYKSKIISSIISNGHGTYTFHPTILCQCLNSTFFNVNYHSNPDFFCSFKRIGNRIEQFTYFFFTFEIKMKLKGKRNTVKV